MNIEEAKMQNYKIKVANEAESKEAQELLFELGYSWGEEGKILVDIEGNHFIANYLNTSHLFYSSNVYIDVEKNKQITLPQLRDLAVLHRNNVSDATHKSDFVGHKFFVASNGKAYGFNENKWQPKMCKSFLEPITQEEQMTLQNALQAFGEGKEVEALDIDGWFNLHEWELGHLKDAKGYRLAPKRKELNGNFTKEELLKIAGEME